MGLLYESMAYLKSSKKLFGSIRITSTYFSLPTWNENGVVYSAWFLTSYHANANNYQQALDDVLWMNITVKFLEEALMSPSNETRFSFSLECIQNFNFPIQPSFNLATPNHPGKTKICFVVARGWVTSKFY